MAVKHAHEASAFDVLEARKQCTQKHNVNLEWKSLQPQPLQKTQETKSACIGTIVFGGLHAPKRQRHMVSPMWFEDILGLYRPVYGRLKETTFDS